MGSIGVGVLVVILFQFGGNGSGAGSAVPRQQATMNNLLRQVAEQQSDPRFMHHQSAEQEKISSLDQSSLDNLGDVVPERSKSELGGLAMGDYDPNKPSRWLSEISLKVIASSV